MNTTTCGNCQDRGVVHVEVGGGYLYQQCNCQPPEHWEQKFQSDLEAFKRRFDEWRMTCGGGEKGGEIQHAGRQEYQLF